MSKPGRKPLEMPRRRMTLYIRQDLAAKVELIIADPMRERAKYGARTDYFESLVERDLRERQYNARLSGSPPVPGPETDSGGPLPLTGGKDEDGRRQRVGEELDRNGPGVVPPQERPATGPADGEEES